MTLGEKIRLARLLCGLKQTDVAQKTGVTQKTVVSYEKNEFKSSSTWILRFSEMTGICTEFFEKDLFCSEKEEFYIEENRETKKELELFKKFVEKYISRIKKYKNGVYVLFYQCQDKEKFISLKCFFEIEKITQRKIDFIDQEYSFHIYEKELKIKKIIEQMKKHGIDIKDLEKYWNWTS